MHRISTNKATKSCNFAENVMKLQFFEFIATADGNLNRENIFWQSLSRLFTFWVPHVCASLKHFFRLTNFMAKCQEKKTIFIKLDHFRRIAHSRLFWSFGIMIIKFNELLNFGKTKKNHFWSVSCKYDFKQELY